MALLAVVLILIAVGAAVAAILVLNPFKKVDPVSEALTKLVSAELPSSAEASGEVVLYNNSDDEGVLNLTTNLAVKIIDKNIYFKVDSLSGDKWIYLPSSNISSVESFLPEGIDTTCLVGGITNDEYRRELIKAYKTNPFVEYKTDGLAIDSKKDTLYQLVFNETKLTAFAEAVKSIAARLTNCADISNEGSAETTILENLPTVYVEIDKDYNFTRLYAISGSKDGLSGMTIDMTLNYAGKVEAPTEYTTLEEIFTQMFMNLFDEGEDEETIDFFDEV